MITNVIIDQMIIYHKVIVTTMTIAYRPLLCLFFCVFVAVKVLFEMYWIIKLYRFQLVSVQHSARCASIHQPNRQHPPTSANVLLQHHPNQTQKMNENPLPIFSFHSLSSTKVLPEMFASWLQWSL